MMSSDSFLGTIEPMSHISTNWYDFFTLSYEALFQHQNDSDMAIKLALGRWIDFGSVCDEGFLNNVTDILTAKRYLLEEISATKDWMHQRKCFELLMRLHDRLGEFFDKVALSSDLIRYNDYFYLLVVEGFCENEQWNEAVETACTALLQIQSTENTNSLDECTHQEIRAGIQSMLTVAYEQLSDFEKAFETAKLMFTENESFALYKRTRTLSEKANNVPPFLESAEKILGPKRHIHGFMRRNLLREIYSYEGETLKLLKMVKSKKIEMNYYDRKYVALSLIYRALINETNIKSSLSEYISSSADQDGIVDMHIYDYDASRQEELLLQGSDLLRGIISFHINAASRNRYAKAAYYMCVIRDIFAFLNREDEFKGYFSEIISQNSRRPALRDEMSIVYGKEAISVKKRD